MSKTAKFTFHVPSDALLARFETRDNYVPAGTDINIRLHRAGTTNA
jgi:hypothetical protein